LFLSVLIQSSFKSGDRVLTGQLGKNPGWDPLQVAVEEAHQLGMELHAWINVFPAWQVTELGDPPPRTDPLHVAIGHPEWLACNASGKTMPFEKSLAKHNYVFLSPTNDGVREHIRQVVAELVEGYRIDGLHLDYVRFADSSFSYDLETMANYVKEVRQEEVTFSEWRRSKLTEFVGELSRTAKSIRPEAQVSAAVWQKIGAGRLEHFQDGLAWASKGYVDFLVPMIYTANVDLFEKRLKAYSDSAGASNVVAGIGAYLDAFTDSILVNQLEIAERYSAYGISVFNSDYAIAYSAVLREHLSGDRQE
jgi:uncharacterized lipoprotein YddW (UPF0748 family)